MFNNNDRKVAIDSLVVYVLVTLNRSSHEYFKHSPSVFFNVCKRVIILFFLRAGEVVWGVLWVGECSIVAFNFLKAWFHKMVHILSVMSEKAGLFGVMMLYKFIFSSV